MVKIAWEEKKLENNENLEAPTELNPQDEDTFKEITESINERMKERYVQPISGRIQEMSEVEEVLTKKINNNVILIGEPGVGKTAIVEGLAQRINRNEVPDELKGAEIFELKFNDLMSGAGLMGTLNEKVKSLVTVLKQRPNYILFIDEIHMIMTAGNTTGQTQGGLADQLKPELARGKIKVIGATTNEEYRKYIATEGAFSRRFANVQVDEPNARDTLAMMHNAKEYFKDLYGSDIDESAFISTYELARRWFPNRNFPDKAMRLLDSACNFHKTFPTKISKERQRLIDLQKSIRLELKEATNSIDPTISSKHNLDKLEKELKKTEDLLAQEIEREKKEKEEYNIETNPVYNKLQKLKREFDAYVEWGQLDKASELLYLKIAPLEKQLRKENPTIGYTPSVVTKFDVEHALANTLGKSVDDISASFIDKAKKLPSILKQRVFGQDAAIKSISSSVLRRAVGFSDDKKPIGSFLLLGNTGVGKTETAKALAEALYGSEDDLIVQPLGNVNSVWELTGSGSGFQNSENGSALVNALEKKPSAVILFDEFDKILQREVVNFFLNLLDEGYFITGLGKKISVNNCVILLTANNVKRIDDEYPELLQRLSDRIVYNDINDDILDKIIHAKLKKTVAWAEKAGYLISFDDSVIQFLKRDFNKSLGARQVQNRIEKFITSPIANTLTEFPKQTPITLTAKDLHLEEVTTKDINASNDYTNFIQNTNNNNKKNLQKELEQQLDDPLQQEKDDKLAQRTNNFLNMMKSKK